MARKRTTAQKALKLAWLRPERRLYFARQACRGRGTWPCVWKFWTNGVKFHLGLGKPWQRMGGEPMPVSQLTFGFAFKPFYAILWWGFKRVFWIGDWEWKRTLFENG